MTFPNISPIEMVLVALGLPDGTLVMVGGDALCSNPVCTRGHSAWVPELRCMGYLVHAAYRVHPESVVVLRNVSVAQQDGCDDDGRD